MMNTINNFDDALSTFEDFDFDINDSDELIISPTANNSSTISESDLVGSDMLFMVDEVTPPFINSSFSVMTKNPSSFLPKMMNNNKLDAYAFNPSESAIVKDDESVVSDLYFDSPSTTPPLPPYPKKKRQKIHDHRRVTVDSSGAPSLSDLFGNNSNNASPQVIKKKTTTTKSYHTALKNLAESMKRSQLSRRQVAMQSGQVQDENQAVISSMTKVLSSIEEQLQHGSSSSSSSSSIRSGNTSPVFSSSSSVLSDQSSNQNTSSFSSLSSNHSSMNSLSHDKSSIMKDFFSGTRNTLTDGLENSRNQLRMLASAAAYPYDCNSYVMKRQSSCLY